MVAPLSRVDYLGPFYICLGLDNDIIMEDSVYFLFFCLPLCGTCDR
jgi:hypothetical protein